MGLGMAPGQAPGEGTTLRGARGWMLLLCVLLGVWEPLNVALLAAASLTGLGTRGAGFFFWLVVRLGVVGLGLASSAALWSGRAAGVPLARLSLVLLAAVQVLFITTHVFPNNRPPGTRGPLAVLCVVYYGAWLVYLYRARQVRTIDAGSREPRPPQS